MSDDKIIELGKRMPADEMAERHIRVAIKDIEQGIHYSKEAALSLKAFYKCL